MDKNITKPQTENPQKRSKHNQQDSVDTSPKAHALRGKFRSSADSISEDMSPKLTKEATLPYLRQATVVSPKAGDTFDERQTKLEKQQTHIETVNPIEVSKKVLIKCNVIRPKKENVKTLGKGEGHLMSMSERSLGQIYSEVYHKTIL